MSEKKERKIIISLHQKGENELAPKVETVGEVDDFEWLFAISVLAEKFADTDNSRANTKDGVVDLIGMAVAGGVNGEVEEYINRFILALKEVRDRKLLEMITATLKNAGINVPNVDIDDLIETALKKEEGKDEG